MSWQSANVAPPNWDSDATSLDEAIQRLDEIIRYAAGENHALGYFPVVYRQVTRQVTQVIVDDATPYFENPELVRRVTLDFANRYFKAFRKYISSTNSVEHGIDRHPSDRVGTCWGVAFRRRSSRRLTPIQHVLLGMNAHILYDLAPSVISTARRMQPEIAVKELIPDVFPRINTILQALVNDVQSRINRGSFWLRLLDRLFGSVDERLAKYFLAGLRQQALSNAIALDGVWGDRENLHAMLAGQDEEAVYSANEIRYPNWFLSLLVWLSHRQQQKNFLQFAREVETLELFR